MLRRATLVTCLLASTAIAQTNDKFQYLESVDSEAALQWVDATNTESAEALDGPLYEELYQQALEVLSDDSKLSSAYQIGDYFFELIKDTANPRGRLMRTSRSAYLSGDANWQLVIDIDAKSQADGQAWVYHGLNCFNDMPSKCLLSLSPGGTDADVIREFDALTGQFVQDGFALPLAKSDVTWVSADSWLIATDFGEGSLTDSGYARTVKLIERGDALSDAKTLYHGDTSSVSASSWSLGSGDSTQFVIAESTSFWTRDYYEFNPDTSMLSKLRIPDSARLVGFIADQWVIQPTAVWQHGEYEYNAGDVVLATTEQLINESELFLLLPSERDNIIEDVTVRENGVLIVTLRDVKAHAAWYEFDGETTWYEHHLNLPDNGAVSVQSSGGSADFLIRFESFLVPPSLYFYDANQKSLVLVEQQPETFDATPYTVSQFFATSVDGTQVPYFAIHRNDIALDGTNPAHIFAYGGFRSSLTPSYSGSYEATNGVYGKLWLDRGGVYVLANIRGGGEYGPDWHAAALLENRHKAFEDLESVARDLSDRNISQAAFTSIEGRSNGGLLTGAAMVRHPELFNAVISGVPLLDMRRYHRLLAGASWMGEYGDPDTTDWDFIGQYSPYQNVSAENEYPDVFFYTSTRDDRVHPAHARKMAARMLEQGHEVYYYENREGGHGGSVTAEQLAQRVALSYTFLWQAIDRSRQRAASDQ